MRITPAWPAATGQVKGLPTLRGRVHVGRGAFRRVFLSIQTAAAVRHSRGGRDPTPVVCGLPYRSPALRALRRRASCLEAHRTRGPETLGPRGVQRTRLA
jgi:hypothetical protein